MGYRGMLQWTKGKNSYSPCEFYFHEIWGDLDMDDLTSLNMTFDIETVFNRPTQKNKYTCDYVEYGLIIRTVLSINEQAIISFILMI